LKRTALHGSHVSMGGKIVPFAGWEMPLQFQGILAEARYVRSYAGIFDVSHMGRLDISGPDAANLLQAVLTCDIKRLAVGKAKYSLICNDLGGIIDDTVVYRTKGSSYRLVPNASNTMEVLDWLWNCRKFLSIEAQINAITDETSMIAVQGPHSIDTLQPLCDTDLSTLGMFRIVEANVAGIKSHVATTGYTGEMGFELMTPSENARDIWAKLISYGARPCGLGARDVLRIEAGLLLHGTDINASITPIEAGLDRFVSWTKGAFHGYESLLRQKHTGITKSLVAFRLLEKGIPRNGYPIISDDKVLGNVTSGTYSPTLDTGIGLGYVAGNGMSLGAKILIDIRGRLTSAEVTKLPFYSRKKPYES